MAVYKLVCPACRGKFTYDVSNGWPDYCPIPTCKTYISNHRADDDVVMPNILSFKTRNTDKVARDVMDGSEQRVNLAAEMAGTTAADMSALKITDLNDRKDAEFSVKEVVNPVTQHMAAMQQAGLPVGFGAGDAMGRAAASHTGDTPYAGLRALKSVQSKLNPIGQAPLPLQITNNPNYRSPV